MLAICDWLDRNSGNPDDRIALIRFAERADLIPAAIAAKAKKAFTAAFAAGASVGGGTSLTQAVEKAGEALQGVGGRRVVVLITDGQVAENPAALAQLIARLDEAADSVYLLALDHDNAWTASTHLRWAHLPLTATTRIGALTEGHLAYAIAEILIGETGLTTKGAP